MEHGVVGANVKYCGHEGYFVADIWLVGNCNVVAAGGKVSADNLIRDYRLGKATHLLTDFPVAGYWKPERGVFVVPKKQVRELT